MTTGQPDDRSLEWLAAYADGELGARDRARVEQWLSSHPDARDILDAQESLGPRNAEFWEAARPPQPSARQWEQTLARISADASVRPRSRAWKGWIGTIGLMATAASLVLALPAFERPGPASHIPLPAEVDASISPDDELMQIALEHEVQIISLPEEAADLLIVGHHPMGDSHMVMAGKGDIAVLGVGPDLAGRFPAIPNADGDEDAPVLWAPRDE